MYISKMQKKTSFKTKLVEKRFVHAGRYGRGTRGIRYPQFSDSNHKQATLPLCHHEQKCRYDFIFLKCLKLFPLFHPFDSFVYRFSNHTINVALNICTALRVRGMR